MITIKNRIKRWISWCFILAFLFMNSITVTWAAESGDNLISEEELQNDEVDTEQEIVVPVTDIELSDYEEELDVGSTLSLSATVLPADATENTVTYRSSDESIATVKSTGEVKGIAKGKVTIYVSAGNITREVALTVKVATTGIKVNNDYLILKQGDTYRLTAMVTPEDANQSVTFTSLNETIATVSDSGVVSAKGVGDTSIMISNGESSVAVSVIVNQESKDSDLANTEPGEHGESDEQVNQNGEAEENADASKTAKIDSETLYDLYTSGKTLEIAGDGYRIEIDGKKIVNYKNEFYTDIDLKTDDEGMSFILNQGRFLCGAVRLYLDEAEGKYLYLYNSSKDRYDYIQVDDIKELELTTPGEYRITNQKMTDDSKVLIVVVVVGSIGILIAVGVYIGVRKKYWFW